MRPSGRLIRGSVLAVALILVPEAGCLAGAPYGPATLQIQLEDSIFLEGQSVYMIARLRNNGAADLPDVAPLSPRIGYLRVDLIRRDTGEHLANTMPIEGGTSREGPTLGPGQVICLVRDLSLYFGTAPQDSSGLAARLGVDCLPVGEYILRWEYRQHTGNRKGLAQKIIKGEDIEFAVHSLASDPREESLVKEFLADMPRVGLDRMPLHVYAREWMPHFYGSKYLLRVYGAVGRLLDELDFDAVFDGAAEAAAPPTRLAALLGFRLSMTDDRGKFTREWKERILPRLDHEVERDVLTIEPRRRKLR